MALSYYSLVIKEDGSLWSWGNNSFGQLGLGHTTNQTTPQKVGNAKWKQVSCGYAHIIGIQEDGSLWSWGENYYGSLGLGNNTQQKTPQKVGSAKWKQVTCGQYHTLALQEDGSLWTWGYNNYGQLGLGNTTQKNTPQPVGNAKWKQVVGGYAHTLGIQEDGSLWAWGYNAQGQLGLGNNTNQTTPQPVGTDKWKQVSGGYYHTLALQEDGSLWSWGYNNFGQLGLGNNTNQTSPQKVGNAKWKQVACGDAHTLALQEDGTLWAWGRNDFGQLGLGNNTQQTTPQKVGTAKWKQVAGGAYHTLALQEDGSLWAWGYNGYGQLGLGHTTNQTAPQKIPLSSVFLLMDVLMTITSASPLIRLWYATSSDGKLFTPYTLYEPGHLPNERYLKWKAELSGGAEETVELIHPFDQQAPETLLAPSSFLSVVEDGLQLSGTTTPQWIEHTQAMFMSHVERLQLSETSVGGSNLRIVVSFDDKKTWQTHEAGEWKQVDKNNLAMIQAQGMTSNTLNQIASWQEQARQGRIHLAYVFTLADASETITLHSLATTELLATQTPSLEEILLTIEELSLEGRLKELERLNAINLAKLQFKTNALVHAKKYQLHDLVVDTMEQEELRTTSASQTTAENHSFTQPIILETQYLSKVTIPSINTIKEITVRT